MERIKRFLLDDSATAEMASTVVMVATVGIAGAVAISMWYQQIYNFFSSAGGEMLNWATGWAAPTSPS